jgi:hypothetical protein
MSNEEKWILLQKWINELKEFEEISIRMADSKKRTIKIIRKHLDAIELSLDTQK